MVQGQRASNAALRSLQAAVFAGGANGGSGESMAMSMEVQRLRAETARLNSELESTRLGARQAAGRSAEALEDVRGQRGGRALAEETTSPRMGKHYRPLAEAPAGPPTS